MANKSSQEILSVIVKGPTAQVGAEAVIDTWSPQRKRSQAIKGLVLSWLAAVFTIIIPVLHFVLVPLFAILGPVFFILFLRKKNQVIGGSSSCPECGGQVEFNPQDLNWPLKMVCDKNYDHVEVFPAQ